VTAGTVILLVEGRKPAAERLTPILEEQGFFVIAAHTRREAWSKVQSDNPSAVILDTLSMRFSEQRFCAALQDGGYELPVLMLLSDDAKATDTSDIRGCLRYPFTAKQLISRVNRLLPDPDDEILSVGGVVFYVTQRYVVCCGRETHLTPKQAQLLETFMKHPGEILTRAYLMKQVWDTEYLGDTRTLDVHIHWLRKATEGNPKSPRRICTVRRQGYCFRFADEEYR